MNPVYGSKTEQISANVGFFHQVKLVSHSVSFFYFLQDGECLVQSRWSNSLIKEIFTKLYPWTIFYFEAGAIMDYGSCLKLQERTSFEPVTVS